MPEYIRALIVIYAASVPAMFLAERFSRPFVPRQEFMMWAGCWLATVGVVMLSRNFMILAVFLGLLSLYCHRQPYKPAYFYIVLMVSAPAVDIPVGLGSFANSLIYFNPSRLLAMFFLAPTAFGLFRSGQKATTVDVLVVSYVLLLTVISFRLGKSTEVMRAALICLLDILLPYFVFSRTLTNAGDLRKAMAAVVVATLPVAAISLAEAAKAWRLFQSVTGGWGVTILTPYLFRSGLLRAAATCVSPISLGFACMVAIGCILSVRKRLISDRFTIFAIGLLFCSLYATLSRGPWVGTAALIMITLTFQRGAIVNIARATIAAVACIPILLGTSFGQRIVTLLPFIGGDTDTEDYRVRLVDAAVISIQRNPFFGTADYLDSPEMRAMIQGEGIIDVVNSYIGIALAYGLVSLAVFCAIFAVLLLQLTKLSFSAKGSEWNASALLGTLVAIAITLVTVSSVNNIPYLYWTFIGLCAGVIRCAAAKTESMPQPSTQPAKMKVLGHW